MSRALKFASAWIRARPGRFANRAALECHQQAALARLQRELRVTSPWVSSQGDRPFADWPLLDKASAMANFDRLNTRGLRLDEVLACAQRAEASRDFSPRLAGCTVGLSSGTSGRRGVFVVDDAERAAWAGTVLRRLLPRGLCGRERVALFLRADSRLYAAVRTPWVSIAFFDLFDPFDALLASAQALAPTILVAPAQVLRAIADACAAGRVALAPQRVISTAEVLDEIDRSRLEAVFGTRVHEIYQATEGFLGASCHHGTLHMNEDALLIERNWLDERRFVPVVTDLVRRVQPILRYRLDDVLVCRDTPCPCGDPRLALARVEGRHDDQLRLPGHDGLARAVFADACHRAIAQSLPPTAEYALRQTGPAALALATDAGLDAAAACRDRLDAAFARWGVAVDALAWRLEPGMPPRDFTRKRRRILREPAVDPAAPCEAGV